MRRQQRRFIGPWLHQRLHHLLAAPRDPEEASLPRPRREEHLVLRGRQGEQEVSRLVAVDERLGGREGGVQAWLVEGGCELVPGDG